MAFSALQHDTATLQALSTRIRRDAVTLAHTNRGGHLGSAFSIVDLLVCLYSGFLNVDPQNPSDPARDRFILSKGHGCLPLYLMLAHRGFFPEAELQTYLKDGSRLPGHPGIQLPGIEASTGSLGHGLSIGAGMALAARRDEKPHRTVVLVSDGECDSGSTWEAALFAGHWKLDRLLCIVDSNKIQGFGRTRHVLNLEPFADKWRAFNWHVLETDGHDHSQILDTLAQADAHRGQPTVIIAHTVKGKGVSYMEDTIDWHYWTPDAAKHAQAMTELSSC